MRKPKLALVRPTAAKKAAATQSAAVSRTAARVEEGEARLVVELPEAAHQAIKIRAVERRITIREYVIGLLRADGIEV
jgi:hypothetical protein